MPAFDSLTKILNALQTKPLLLLMGICKHIAYNNCCGEMCQAYVGQLPGETVRTGACNRRTACIRFSTNLSPYTSSIRPYTSRYTAVYSEVYGRILVVYGAH